MNNQFDNLIFRLHKRLLPKSNIPKKDIVYGLPIRWFFHCYVCRESYVQVWHFPRWREYLLSWDKYGVKLLLEQFDTVPNFKELTEHRLIANKANSLAGFIRLYQKAAGDYENLLKSAVSSRDLKS